MTHNNLVGGWVWESPGVRQEPVMDDDRETRQRIADLTARTRQLEEAAETIKARVEALENSLPRDTH